MTTQTPTIRPATLADYIRSHGIAAQVVEGELWAAHTYAVPLKGRIGFEVRWEQVPASFRAVREWLGY